MAEGPAAGASAALDPCAVVIVLMDKTEAALPRPAAAPAGTQGSKGRSLDVYA